jgi:hypothetical protein
LTAPLLTTGGAMFSSWTRMARERMGCEVRLDLALYGGRSCVGSLGLVAE